MEAQVHTLWEKNIFTINVFAEFLDHPQLN